MTEREALIEIRQAWSWYLACGGNVSHDDVREAVTQTVKALDATLGRDYDNGPTDPHHGGKI